jgi:osmoprotectant transport system ATP-binding protein
MATLLDLVRLPRDIAERMPASLSGGQAQRVGVARALAAEPKIVLMDEPFGAVDQITRGALARDYRQLHERLGLTTILVTHDIVEAVLLADRIAIVVAGEIIESGTPYALLSESKNDYVRELMSLPRLQAERIAALTMKGGP